MSEQADALEAARNVATVVSAAAAWAALGLSIFNYMIQRKSLKFVEQKEVRQRSPLEIYVRSLSTDYDHERTRYTSRVTITNPAEIANSVKRSSLLITYNMATGGSSTISMSGFRIDEDDKVNEVAELNIPARSTKNVDFVFDVKAGVLNQTVPRRTVLELEDAEGRSTSLEIVFK